MDAVLLEELEELLITADLGVETTLFLIQALHEKLKRFPPRSTYRVLHPDLQGYWQFFGRVDLGGHVLLVADLSRLAKAPPADRERYAWLDAGCISQNLYLYCASEGLATCVYDLNRPAVAEALGLKSEQYVVMAQAVGKIKK